MAAVVEDGSSGEHVQDRTLSALQVAVVSGFVKNNRGVQEACLGLCNACREGVPVERMSICQAVPQTLLALVVPHAVEAQQEADIPPTRVLQPHRVLRLECSFLDEYEQSELWYEAYEGLERRPAVSGVDDVELRQVRWPEGTKEISLLLFQKTVEGVTWPAGLERLSFCALQFHLTACRWTRGSFNDSLDGANFPSGLREIFLGDDFDQPIHEVIWPQGLERLSLPGFDQPIDNVRWPPALKSLEFVTPAHIHLRKDPNTRLGELDVLGGCFSCPFTTLPASLESFWIGDEFGMSLEGVQWPSGLVTLGLGFNFSGWHGMAAVFEGRGTSWPSGLPNVRNLYLFAGTEWVGRPPSGCKVNVAEGPPFELGLEDDESDVDELDHGVV